MAPTIHRDIVVSSLDPSSGRTAERGRMYVAVIGIDRYRAWGALHNAVSDAQGAQAAFVKLGFEARPPLFDDAATGTAIRNLVTEDLRTLGTNDSLVLFFAGHGHTVTKPYDDGTLSKRGYLIPVDAKAPSSDGSGSWLTLDSWLRDVAHLPPKHILVILDACHSGIALDPVVRWRGEDVRRTDPLAELRARRSRRIITSALDNQLALDGGPVQGHSLFTGCLIEALSGHAFSKAGRRLLTGSEIGLHVQQRVTTYPATNASQTPDFGALELDNRGEMIIELPMGPDSLSAELDPPHLGVDGIRPRKHRNEAINPAPPQRDSVAQAPSGVDTIKPRRARTEPAATQTTTHASSVRPDEAAGGAPPQPVATSNESQSSASSMPGEAPVTEGTQSVTSSAKETPPPSPGSTTNKPLTNESAHVQIDIAVDPPVTPPVTRDEPPRPPSLPPRSTLDAAFVAALDRHDRARKSRGNVLTVVAADPTTAVTGWATWAAERGRLTLVTEGNGLDATITHLLGQMPWLRAIPTARARLAVVAKLDVNAVDEILDGAASSAARDAWIDDVAGHDLLARVSGWLLSLLREPWATDPDLTTAPVQGGDLLSILCELGTPITVLLHHASPTAPWFERAIQTGAELTRFLPRTAVAIGAPREFADSLVRTRLESAAFATARQGVVQLAAKPSRAVDHVRSQATRLLYAALMADRRTAGHFETNVRVPVYDRTIEVDLVAREALFAIEIDDWYRSRDPLAYSRDRIKDVQLSRAQFFVMRFLAEDVEERLEHTVNEIALGLAGRRASGSFVENAQ
jgi:very-short-patch-repair endonuclease